MKKNEKVALERKESEEMLNIIHQNHKVVYERKLKKAKIINNIQNVLLVIAIIVFVFMIIYLTADRKQAIKNCMKNHSQNYCERISG